VIFGLCAFISGCKRIILIKIYAVILSEPLRNMEYENLESPSALKLGKLGKLGKNGLDWIGLGRGVRGEGRGERGKGEGETDDG
jgi:hypothetical protein